eukprot:4480877-Pyramimonas_sp.AAC.1
MSSLRSARGHRTARQSCHRRPQLSRRSSAAWYARRRQRPACKSGLRPTPERRTARRSSGHRPPPS